MRFLRALLDILLPRRAPEVRFYLSMNPEDHAVAGRYIVDARSECDGCGTAAVRATHRFILRTAKGKPMCLDMCDHHARRHAPRLRERGWIMYELRLVEE